MKIKFRIMVLFVVMVFMLTACSFVPGTATPSKPPTDQFAYDAYGTLATAMSARDIAMKFVTNLHNVKQVSEEKWAEINKIDDNFLTEYAKAATKMSDYKKGIIDMSIAQLALTGMNKALDALKDYYAKQIPADGKPLIN